VEGYFDVVRLVGNGIEEVVAPLGTALTSDQAALLAKYTRNVFLLYDSDKAGLKATFRSGDELLSQGASVRVVTLPDGEDPDTFVQKFGRDALEEQLDQAIDVFERKVQLLQRGGWFSDLHRRRQAIDRLLPTIRAAVDPLTRDMYIGRAAEASGIDRQVLGEEAGEPAGQRPRGNRWSSAPAPTTARAPSAASEAQRTPRRVSRSAPATRGAGSSAERELVRAMIQSRGLVERVAERVGPDQFRFARFREIFDTRLRVAPVVRAAALTEAMSRDATEAYDRLAGDPEVIQDLERTVHDCLTRIQTRDLEERRDEIQKLLLAAHDVEKDRLVREKEQIRDEIRRLAESGSSL
jgi:DNA primase